MAIDDDLCGMSYLVSRAGVHILTRICSIFILHNLHVFAVSRFSNWGKSYTFVYASVCNFTCFGKFNQLVYFTWEKTLNEKYK